MKNTESNRRPFGFRAAWAMLLVAQILSFAHLLLVQHSICPVHGEWVDQGQVTASRGDRIMVASGDAPTVIQNADESITTDQHDHCLVTTHRKSGALVSIWATASFSIFQSTPAASRLPSTQTLTSLSLLRLAPKNSPPRLLT